MNRFSSIFGLLLLLCTTAHAYETTTHAYVTNEAFNRSVLADTSATSVFVRLGFDRLDAARPFQSPLLPLPLFNPDEGAVFTGQGYWDLVPNGSGFNLVARDPYTPFEQRLTNELLANNRLPGFVESKDGQFVYKMQGWMSRGAIREDDLSLGFKRDYDNDSLGNFFRVFNHFYDPVHNVGLGAIAGMSTCTSLQPCLRAVDWATGLVDAMASPSQFDTQSRNHYNWESAREAEFRALTSRRDHNGNGTYEASDAQADSEERYFMWSTTLRALGDVVHLIQDMAQPQHTRQDIHSPFITSAARQTFEAFTDLRVIRDFSQQNQNKSVLREINGGFPSEGYVTQPFLGIGSPAYPTVSFAMLRSYFTTQPANPSGSPTVAQLLGRRGMADFSNRTFFTDGTPPSLFSSFPLPPNDLSDAGYSIQPNEGTLWVNNSRVTYSQLTRAVTDAVDPTYIDPVSQQYAGKIPLLTAGSWYNYALLLAIPETAFSVDLYNYTVMADVLLPRALAYSTGAINYFFRGQLTLSSPPDGLYAVTDQGTPHAVNAQGYPCLGTATNDGCAIFGFTLVRVRVKNTTPDITESGSGTVVPQTMHDGQLVAVARYHRNPCYQPDLSGEYVRKPDGSLTVPSGCSIAQTRTAYQEISVSAPLAIDANGNFPGTNDGSNACANVGNIQTGATATCADSGGVLGEFDFSTDPIPINATDLFIQVVYRGPLGQELDGIAVGTKDILEPNFYTVWNNTDWFIYNGVWTLPENVPDPPVVPADAASGPLTADIVCFSGQLISGLATGQQLDPARFFRTAVLADIQPLQLGEVTVFDNQISYVTDGPMPSTQRQADTEQGANYAPDPIPFYGRGTTLGLSFAQYYQYYGDIDQDQYIAVLKLEPTLGDPSSPGIALPVGLQFTSEPEENCSYYFPGPYTTVSTPLNPVAGPTGATGSSQSGSRLPH